MCSQPSINAIGHLRVFLYISTNFPYIVRVNMLLYVLCQIYTKNIILAISHVIYIYNNGVFNERIQTMAMQLLKRGSTSIVAIPITLCSDNNNCIIMKRLTLERCLLPSA